MDYPIHVHFPSPPAQTATVEAAEGILPVRAAPMPTAAVIGSVQDGAVLSLCGRCGGWAAVRWQGQRGFLPSDALVLHFRPCSGIF